MNIPGMQGFATKNFFALAIYDQPFITLAE
jgi:hypothetical protein